MTTDVSKATCNILMATAMEAERVISNCFFSNFKRIMRSRPVFDFKIIINSAASLKFLNFFEAV